MSAETAGWVLLVAVFAIGLWLGSARLRGGAQAAVARAGGLSDPIGDLERAAALLRALPPVLVRCEMPGEVWAMWKALLPVLPLTASEHASMASVPIEINDDLPSLTYRLHMSDGTHTAHKGR